MPLKPFSRARPIRHSGPAVWVRNVAKVSVTESVTIPTNTPVMRP